MSFERRLYCEVCDKSFIAHHPKTKYCSAKCKKYAHLDKARINSREKLEMRKALYRELNPLKKCAICDKELEHNNQKYCIECLLKCYSGELELINVRKAYKILNCRGYTKKQIYYELKERGMYVP